MKRRPPSPQTRHSIERELADKRHRLDVSSDPERFIARLEAQTARMKEKLGQAEFARVHAEFEHAVRKLKVQLRRRRRRPGEGGLPALVEPPRGPRPLSGGAAAPLEFDS